MKLLVFLLPVIAVFLYSLYKVRRVDRELEMFDLHCDMWDKMQELLDNPTMSYLKWKEWLPVFKAADERCKRLDPKMATILGRISDKVEGIIKDDGYQQDLQRR